MTITIGPSLPEFHISVDSTSELNDKQSKLMDLLRSLQSEDLYAVFNEEQVYEPQLRKINGACLVALLQPHVRMWRIIDIQEKLIQWRKKGRVTPKVDLKTILNKKQQLLRLPYLNNPQRKLLVEAIVDYFLFSLIPFTQELRDDVAQQIVDHYNYEDKVNPGLINYLTSLSCLRLCDCRKLPQMSQSCKVLLLLVPQLKS